MPPIQPIARPKVGGVWLFSALTFGDKNFKAGDTVTIQIMRVGTWDHPIYGEVKITANTIADVIRNFQEDTRGIELAVDENHEPDHRALGWYRQVYSEDANQSAFAKIELTQKGANLLNEGAYKYFSPEIQFSHTDDETGEQHRNLLIGGAFTNRPYFKRMQPLMASEAAADESSSSLLPISTPRMQKFLSLLNKLVEKDTISASEKAALETAYNALPESERKDKKIAAAFDEVVAKPDEGTPTPETPETPEAPVETPVETPEAPETPETPVVPEVPVEASEKTITMSAAKFAEMQTTLSKLARDARFNEIDKSLEGLAFSEKNAAGLVLPKDRKEIREFAASLSEKSAVKFFSILKGLKQLGAEKGHDGDTAGSFTDGDTVQFFMEKMSMSQKDAEKAAQAAQKIKERK